MKLSQLVYNTMSSRGLIALQPALREGYRSFIRRPPGVGSSDYLIYLGNHAFVRARMLTIHVYLDKAKVSQTQRPAAGHNQIWRFLETLQISSRRPARQPKTYQERRRFQTAPRPGEPPAECAENNDQRESEFFLSQSPRRDSIKLPGSKRATVMKGLMARTAARSKESKGMEKCQLLPLQSSQKQR